MPDMHHEIHIQAPVNKVYCAIATQEGLRSWWTADSVVESREEGSAEFGFFKRATLFRMRITEMVPNTRVVWKCLGETDEWKGTELTWDLSKNEDGTALRFKHGGWKSVGGHFGLCNSTWGMLMYRLKDYAEGGNPGPYWKE
jgi:uncharacterized protein YndB with AHSA1/START domain